LLYAATWYQGRNVVDILEAKDAEESLLGVSREILQLI
jgi:hypothetical protein